MRNVHYTCDSCGDVLQRAGFNARGEHDSPDVRACFSESNALIHFDLCGGCLRRVVDAIRPNAAKCDVKLRHDLDGSRSNDRTIGDVLDARTPYNATTAHSSRQP